jgi:hypothetical protein
MVGDDLRDQRQAKAGAVLAARDEGLEDIGGDLGRMPGPSSMISTFRGKAAEAPSLRRRRSERS